MRSYTLTYPLKIALGTFLMSLWVVFTPVVDASTVYTNIPTTGTTTPIEVAFSRGLIQPTDNFGEIAGIKIMDTWNLDGFRSIGLPFCRTTGAYNLNLVAVHLDENRNHIATSTTVAFTDVPYCNTFASTTPSLMPLQYFTFPSTFDFKDRSFVVFRPLEITSYDVGMKLYGTGTGTVVPFTNKNCYWNDSSQDYSCPYDGLSSLPYFKILDTATTATPPTTPPPTTATQYIQITAPEYGTTTDNSTSITVHFQTPFSIDFRPTTTRTVVIRDAVTLAEEWRDEEILEANAGENRTVNYPVYLANGSKLVFAYYAKEDGTIFSETAQSFFNVNTNTYELATGLVTPNSTPTETQNDCGTFDVGCQFQKALMFLFYPSQAVLDRFSSLWQNISTKKPFGYVTMTIDALTNLDTNSAHAFDLGEVPFQTAIFDPFKLALGSILWAIYAIYFYQRRLKTLDI